MGRRPGTDPRINVCRPMNSRAGDLHYFSFVGLSVYPLFQARHLPDFWQMGCNTQALSVENYQRSNGRCTHLHTSPGTAVPHVFNRGNNGRKRPCSGQGSPELGRKVAKTPAFKYTGMHTKALLWEAAPSGPAVGPEGALYPLFRAFRSREWT